MVSIDASREKLIALLQLAYSGELAAAHAYRGHWHSGSDADERSAIHNIEDDEWRHRKLVGEMLAILDTAPRRYREFRSAIIGRSLGFLCHITGWLAPMYGAGKLESQNVKEYETAARLARECGREDLIDCLLEMAEVEWEHEFYFRSCVRRHAFGRRLRLWPQPPPKETIRLMFAREDISPPRQEPLRYISEAASRED